MAEISGWILLSLAAIVTALNFYLSFLSYPIHHLIGWQHRNDSGLPMVGTIFCAAGLIFLWRMPLAWACSGLIALFDTGGVLWLLFSTLFRPKRNNVPPARGDGKSVISD
jgi:hypothetical protein